MLNKSYVDVDFTHLDGHVEVTILEVVDGCNGLFVCVIDFKVI